MLRAKTCLLKIFHLLLFLVSPPSSALVRRVSVTLRIHPIQVSVPSGFLLESAMGSKKQDGQSDQQVGEGQVLVYPPHCPLAAEVPRGLVFLVDRAVPLPGL